MPPSLFEYPIHFSNKEIASRKKPFATIAILSNATRSYVVIYSSFKINSSLSAISLWLILKKSYYSEKKELQKQRKDGWKKYQYYLLMIN